MKFSFILCRVWLLKVLSLENRDFETFQKQKILNCQTIIVFRDNNITLGLPK